MNGPYISFDKSSLSVTSDYRIIRLRSALFMLLVNLNNSIDRINELNISCSK